MVHREVAQYASLNLDLLGVGLPFHLIAGFELLLGPRYPDFYKEDVVLDAKYKRYEDIALQNIDGDDLHQVITYMYILSARHGGLIVPGRYERKGLDSAPKTLKGYGGSMNIYSISVDAPGLSYKAYCQQMAQFEKEFINQIILAESES